MLISYLHSSTNLYSVDLATISLRHFERKKKIVFLVTFSLLGLDVKSFIFLSPCSIWVLSSSPSFGVSIGWNK